MISDVKDVLEFILGLYKSNINNNKEDFDFYITNLFERAKIIEQNYITILSEIKYNLIFNNWRGYDTLKYLIKTENEFKSERIYIRELMKTLNKKYDYEIEKFVASIMGIMYCCKYVDRFSEDRSGIHRFDRLIKEARDLEIHFSFQQVFLDDIDFMLNEVNSAWKVTCSEYFKLKQKQWR